MKGPEPLRRAYHECGHALVSILIGFTPTELTLESLWHEAQFGRCHSKWEHNRPQPEELTLQLCLGGPCGEELFGPVDEKATCHDDMREAAELAAEIVHTQGLWESVDMMSDSEDECVPVMKEAKACDELNHERCQNVIEHHRTIVRGLIQRNRPTLEALVKELMEKKTLRREEIAQIFADSQNQS
jgi:ATP-dependent Zn protease